MVHEGGDDRSSLSASASDTSNRLTGSVDKDGTTLEPGILCMTSHYIMQY